MPRNVRNFWIELWVDGRKTKIATGPVRKSGGFKLKVFQRNRGEIVEVVSLDGMASEGALWISGFVDGQEIFKETRR